VKEILVVYKHSSNRICGGAVWGCRKWSCAQARPEVESPEMTSPEVASPEVVNRIWKGDNFPRFFPGTSLESRYEQWNCEFNLYRVTIALLPHFPSWIVQSAVINWLSGMCMQYMTAFFYVLLFVCFFRK
jgi:hypothetical protein